MIEDEKIGLKIAENQEEAYWTTTKERCMKANELMKREIELNEVIASHCDIKLTPYQKEKDINPNTLK